MQDDVLDGPYMPMKKKVESEELELKLRSKWTKVEVKKVQVNFKAINTLHCAWNPTEFNRISTCKMAKEIQDKLKVTHKGTSQVKKSKITLISNQCEMFKMQPNESITSWFDQYTIIVNQLNQLGRVIAKDEMVKRLLKSLLEIWRSMVITIREAKDLNKIFFG